MELRESVSARDGRLGIVALILGVSLLAIALGAKVAFASVDLGCKGGALYSHDTGQVVGFLCATSGCVQTCSKQGGPSSPPTPNTSGQFMCICPGAYKAGCSRIVTWDVDAEGEVHYQDGGCIGPCLSPAACEPERQEGAVSYVDWCLCK